MAHPFFLTKLLARTGLARFLPGVQRRSGGAAAFLHYYSDRVLAAPLDDLNLAGRFHAPAAPDDIDLAHATPRFAEFRTPNSELRTPAPAWGLAELRAAVAERLYSDYRLSVNPADEVLVTHGASGAFSTAVDAFLNAGGAAVLFDPCSPLFALMLRQRRAKIRWVPTWTDQGKTRFHPDPFARAMRGAKLLALSDPVNPTGGTFAPEDLEQIAWWANRHDVLVVQDDSFARYQYEGGRLRLASFPAAARRTVTIGGVSKGYGLPSARVGWLAGHLHLARPCALTQTLTAPFVATASQHLALAALRTPDTLFEAARAVLAGRRQYVYERLHALGLTPMWPSGGFFFWVPVQPLGMSGMTFADRLLRSKQVLVSPGELYGPGGGCVRLSYGGEEGRLLEGLKRLAEFVSEVRPGSPPVARLAPDDAPHQKAA